MMLLPMLSLLLALLAPAAAAPSCERVALPAGEAPCATPAIGRTFHDCGAAPLAAAGLHAPDRSLRDRPAWRAEGDLAVRQAYEGTFDSHETEHFAVWWGEYQGFDQADVEELAAAFEASWAVEIEELGWPAPTGTDTHKLNVYIGDSGPDTPSGMGAAGYFWFDPEGWPMIVVAASQVGTDSAAITAAHEFLHASQDAAATYEYDRRGAWYHEATAVWVESEVWPDDPMTAAFLYWFAIRPELALDHFVYPSAGEPEEYHQYGAFLFVEYLDAFVGGPDLVRRTWTEGAPAGDPMRTLDALLPDESTSLDEAFFAFADRNATWDWPEADLYEDWIANYGGWGNLSHRPTVSTLGATEGWLEPPADLPRTYGANYWRLRDLPEGGSLSFAGATGEDAPRAWHVSVAVEAAGTHHRAVLDLVDGAGELPLDELGEHDEAWLVVAAADTLRDAGTTFDYAVRIDEPPPNPLFGGEGARACGCASGGGPGPWGLLLVPWLISLRAATGRRRSRSR